MVLRSQGLHKYFLLRNSLCTCTHESKGILAILTLASMWKVRVALVSFGAVAEVASTAGINAHAVSADASV